MRRGWLVAGLIGALMLVGQALLARVVADTGLVASLLSPGGLTIGRAALAVGFVGLRLVGVLVGPGMIAGAVVDRLVNPPIPSGSGRTPS